MITRSPTNDPKCVDLAEAFLEDEGGLNTTRHVTALAEEIQNTIENYLDRERANLEPPDPPGFEGGFADNH